MDASLIDRARAGDRVALEQLLEQVAPLAYRFGMRMCRHQADAEDVLQDTLLSVATHMADFEGRASLASWVFALARSACVRRRRGHKNQAHAPEEEMDRLSSSSETPEHSAGDSELRRALEGALGALSDEHREVVLLRDMEGLSAAEVAASLAISVDAVKSRLHRGRAALREELRGVLERDAPASQPGCPDVLAAFSAKLEEELGVEDCEAMEQHIAACPACASACSAVRTALWACRTQPHGDVPPDVQARVRAAVRSLAEPRTT